MKVNSYIGEYEAAFYSDFSFADELKQKQNKFFVIDAKVYDLYQDVINHLIEDEPYYLVEAIEENKNVDRALLIMEQLVELKSKRNTLLIAIGGGIVQDLCAFVSNVIYRGISWYLIPTTLLAQTDSCIGSKTSLNFKQYKNLLGYFYPPTQIFINTSFIHTLDERDYFSGLGEIMKCALMDGYQSFCDTKDHLENLLARNDDIVKLEIIKALNFKKKVIEIDEFDRGYRNIMNFGHTFGHALESTSNYEIPHGQGVSFGMMIANEISVNRELISKEKKNEINAVIAQIVHQDLLKEQYLETKQYLNVLKKDKKYTGSTHTCILWRGEGVERFSDITDEEIVMACKQVLEEMNSEK